MTTQITRRTMLKQACGITLGGAAAVAGFNLKDAVAQPVTGTGIDVLGPDFEGVLSGLTATLDRANDVINVAGTIVGTVLSTGTAVNDTFTAVIDTLEGDPAACDILYLTLGPLDLDLLGLEVNLDTVTLNIDAVPGAGNLLGNLLCAVTGLLDNPSGSLSGITNLLNRIFSILG